MRDEHDAATEEMDKILNGQAAKELAENEAFDYFMDQLSNHYKAEAVDSDPFTADGQDRMKAAVIKHQVLVDLRQLLTTAQLSGITANQRRLTRERE